MTINLSILDFKFGEFFDNIQLQMAINLSILDFKYKNYSSQLNSVKSINLSILDFKYCIFKWGGRADCIYKSIHTGF